MNPSPAPSTHLLRLNRVDPRTELTHGLTTEVCTGESVFDLLRHEWRAAVESMPRCSVFMTHEYIVTAWRHFHTQHDQPWVMTVRDANRLVGILPLVRSKRRVFGMPGYELHHMGLWQGDRPGLIATIEPDRVWAAVFDTLRAMQSQWQQLKLLELDEGAWPLRHATGLRTTWRCKIAPSTQAAYQPVKGVWSDFLASRSRNTRQAYTRRQRQLSQAHPDWSIEIVDDASQIATAFDRYAQIELRGWKSASGIGLWSDTRQLSFYRELLPLMAREGRASVWFLRAGGVDAAGLVRLTHGEVAYERLASFDPAFAAYSPSTLLCMEAVRRLFGTGYRESDALGMAQPLGQRPAIAAWYDGMRQTHRLTITHLASSLALGVAARSVTSRLRNTLRRRQGTTEENAT